MTPTSRPCLPDWTPAAEAPLRRASAGLRNPSEPSCGGFIQRFLFMSRIFPRSDYLFKEQPFGVSHENLGADAFSGPSSCAFRVSRGFSWPGGGGLCDARRSGLPVHTRLPPSRPVLRQTLPAAISQLTDEPRAKGNAAKDFDFDNLPADCRWVPVVQGVTNRLAVTAVRRFHLELDLFVAKRVASAKTFSEIQVSRVVTPAL
ncbi:hypothetical protein AAFF_G00359300 [Aldrovandia affinis]|uniref:Uncharacterized protein n=1 Tax=Aldrovandia affinis TaxID=143900 RepID=A0AAD7SI73_9TELE|nr:hypothetical protein AAFF_G00359300 [Aldrovandia affinis]